MSALPVTRAVDAARERVQLERLLKRDDFGRVELWSAAGRLHVRRVACGGPWPGSAFVARALLAREQRALARLDGLAGIPRLLDSGMALKFEAQARGEARRRGTASDCGWREWVAGRALHEAEELPRDYFDNLRELVCRLHERGVCHNDLHKEQNVLVAQDGFPWLVDFQLASVHARRGGAFAQRCADDLRHVEKHRRRYLLAGRPKELLPAEQRVLPRRSWLALVWRRTGKPLYNFVTRRVLGTRDGEARRSSAGPWPRWGPPSGRRPRVSSPGNSPASAAHPG